MAAGLPLQRHHRGPVAYAVAVSLFVHLLLLAWLQGFDIDTPESLPALPLTAELQPARESPREARVPEAKPPSPRLPSRKKNSNPPRAAETPAPIAQESAAVTDETPAVEPAAQNLPVAAEAASPPSEPVKEVLDPVLVGRYRMALICALKRHRSFPLYAQKREWTGKVRMRVDFVEGGHLQDVKIIRSSGHSILDENAVDTVRKAQADMPVPARLLVHRFSVEQEIEYRFDAQASNEAPLSCPSF